MAENTDFARLENWDFNVVADRFRGEIHGDDRFEDGTLVTTSPINFNVTSNLIVEGAVVRTRNTRYLLGKPNGVGVFHDEDIQEINEDVDW